jgi:hypothetical protein
MDTLLLSKHEAARLLGLSVRSLEHLINELEELDRQLDEFEKPIIAWANKVGKFATDVVTRAEQTREQAERNYKICTRAGYFLYTLGWSLALVGKRGGVEGALGKE